MIITKLFEPRVALIIFLALTVAYLVFLDREQAFQKKFLHFGPSPDSRFLNIKLDSWGKVIAVYIIGFISALGTSYYTNITSSYVSGVLLNPAYKEKIQHTRLWGSILVAIDPIMSWVMKTFQFFITLTMELQYIIPQFLGDIMIAIPNNLINVSRKKFSTD